MSDSSPPGDRTSPSDPLRGHLIRKLRSARWALAWETFWAALWPTPLLVGLFVAFALFDLPQIIGGWWHGLALVIFAVLLCLCAATTVRRFRWPRPSEAERRLERASGLRHRPLAALADRPAGTGAEGAALWSVRAVCVIARSPRSPIVRQGRGQRVRLSGACTNGAWRRRCAA